MDATVGVVSEALALLAGPLVPWMALVVIGLNVQYAHGGLLNLGQHAFALLAGYGMGSAVAVFGAPLWLGALVGIGLAVGVAVLLGAASLRVSRWALPVVTLGAAVVILRLPLVSPLWSLTGGHRGLRGFGEEFQARNPIPPGDYRLWLVDLGSHEQLWTTLVAWLLVVLASVLVVLLLRSPWGRALRAARDDPDTARSLGKDAHALQLQALGLGTALAATSGVVSALLGGELSLGTQVTPWFGAYTALLLGAVGGVAGPVVGAALYLLLMRGVSATLWYLHGLGWLPPDLGMVGLPDLGPAVEGLVLVLLYALRPNGLLARRHPVRGPVWQPAGAAPQW